MQKVSRIRDDLLVIFILTRRNKWLRSATFARKLVTIKKIVINKKFGSKKKKVFSILLYVKNQILVKFLIISSWLLSFGATTHITKLCRDFSLSKPKIQEMIFYFCGTTLRLLLKV